MKQNLIIISAIIAAYNYPELTNQCIKLLRETLAEFPHEIIFVDYGSADSRLRTDVKIQLIRNDKQL